jgi:hypothetical protein
MSQLVVINKENAALGLGIRIQFFDNVGLADNEVIKFEGQSIVYRDNSVFDGWLIFAGAPNAEGPWMFINKSKYTDNLEILGEL